MNAGLTTAVSDEDASKHLDRLKGIEDGSIPYPDVPFIGMTNAYLFASYAYYEMDVSLISDFTYDMVCAYLLENFDALEMLGVWHVGKVIVKDNLAAGTCIGIEYPDYVKAAVPVMVRLKNEDSL